MVFNNEPIKSGRRIKIIKVPFKIKIKKVWNSSDHVIDNNLLIRVISSSDTDYISCDIQLKEEKYRKKGLEWFGWTQLGEF